MKLELPIVKLAPIVEKYGGHFADLFENRCQFQHFRNYVAGLIAFLLHQIFQKNGVHYVWITLQFAAREAVIAFFWFPVRLLSLLFRAITGMMNNSSARHSSVINKGGSHVCLE